MKEIKKELRKKIAQQKSLYTPQILKIKSDAILEKLEKHPAFIKARTVLLYHSLKDEVQTHIFAEKWKNNKTLLLPVVIGNDLELRYYTGKQDMSMGAYGILEPGGRPFTDFNAIDVVIVPGVAFDKKGNRLGRGKGYYDRLLPKLMAYKIGICYDFQVCELIPTEEFDIKMDALITEEEIFNEK